MLVGCKEEHPVRVGGLRAAPDGTSNREIEGTQPMNRMRISLFYLGSYLAIIGLGLLFVPHETLKILQSKGDYDDVFPRVAGMLDRKSTRLNSSHLGISY